MRVKQTKTEELTESHVTPHPIEKEAGKFLIVQSERGGALFDLPRSDSRNHVMAARCSIACQVWPIPSVISSSGMDLANGKLIAVKHIDCNYLSSESEIKAVKVVHCLRELLRFRQLSAPALSHTPQGMMVGQ